MRNRQSQPVRQMINWWKFSHARRKFKQALVTESDSRRTGRLARRSRLRPDPEAHIALHRNMERSMPRR